MLNSYLDLTQKAEPVKALLHQVSGNKVKTENLDVDEQDDEIPFKQRMKNFLAAKLKERERKKAKASLPSHITVKTEEVDDASQGVFLSYAGVYTVGDGKKLLKQSSANSTSERNVAAVSIDKSEVDSLTVQLHSQVASSCHYGGFPGDYNRQNAHENAAISLSQTTYPEVEGCGGRENVDTTPPNLFQNPTISTFPNQIKLEYPEDIRASPCKHATHASGLTVESCKSKKESHDEMGSDELDHIPLRERRRMLLLTCYSTMRQSMATSREMNIDGLMEGEGKKRKFLHDQTSDERITKMKTAVVSIDKNRVDPCTIQLLSQVSSGCYTVGFPGDCKGQEAQASYGIGLSQIINSEVKGDARPENIDNNTHISTFPTKVKIECCENDLATPPIYGTHASGHLVFQACNAKKVRSEMGTDQLDHIPLQERRRMLLSASCSSRHSFETSREMHIGKVASMDDIDQQKAQEIKDIQYSIAGHGSHSIPEPNSFELLRSSSNGSSSCNMAGPSSGVQASAIQGSALTSFNQFGLLVDRDSVFASTNNMVGSALPTLKNVEAMGFNGLESPHVHSLHININDMVAVKSELGILYETNSDELDHLSLRQRRKLLITGDVLDSDTPRNLKCLRKTVPSSLRCNPTASQTANPEGLNSQRRRKKTATDSVETALKEDAPGLLQVLIDKGIMVDEIKLYGGVDYNNALDSPLDEDNFQDHEAVVSKLFSQPSSLLKFAPLRCTKGSKPSYCLGCLISLVEQVQYLQLRKWPVEWGWCRGLQSFIFLFERHNRIVLERPEYGFATYFFELVDSIPADWQIKRLVTAMKLTTCSRINLIENKALLVGEDLTEGEAKVLEEYGWTPNSGLGSMLNYCDRVYHDRKYERDGSEWRNKIGRLLMNGYNGGTIVLANLPKKVTSYKQTQADKSSLEL